MTTSNWWRAHEDGLKCSQWPRSVRLVGAGREIWWAQPWGSTTYSDVDAARHWAGYRPQSDLRVGQVRYGVDVCSAFKSLSWNLIAKRVSNLTTQP